MNPSSSFPHRRSWSGKVLAAGAALAFLLLGLWASALVRRSRQVQAAFDRAGGQAVQITGLLDGLNRLHQAGSAVLQSYAVGYQRLVFEKTFDQYLEKRLAPRIPWDPSCGDCLTALDGAVRIHQAQARRAFDLGERWEALPAGAAKERARAAVADELFALEQAQGKVLAAFRDLEASNRDLLALALSDHQRHARQVYAFAGTTLLLALGFLGLASFAWIQTRRVRLAERLTRTLMDVVPDGLLVWNGRGRVVKANPAACGLLGGRERDLLGQPAARWLPSAVSECLGGDATSQEVSFTLIREGGPPVPLEASAGCLRTREGDLHVGVFRDITRRLESELRMREAQKLEAVGALAAGVVHDVRNLLAPVGLAEEILAEMPGRTPAEQRLLEQIHRSAEAANTLLNQLLRIARKGATAPSGTADLHACIEESLALIRLSLGRAIRVETRLAPGEATVPCDRVDLVQVFSNLFLNAAHAMHGEGRLTVESTFRDANLEVRVSDTGDGMPPEVQAKIFEPMFTTKGKEGTGLGLFTVKRILEGIGGSIQVESAPGAGSNFLLRFPACACSPALTPIPANGENLEEKAGTGGVR